MTTWFDRAKRDTVLALLSECSVVGVGFTPADGVTGLPEEFAEQDSVTLHIGYDLPVPIYKFKVDEDGIAGVFSFRRTPHEVFVPWKAVRATYDAADDKEVVFFHALLAHDVLSKLPEPPKPKEVPRVKFTVIEGGKK